MSDPAVLPLEGSFFEDEDTPPGLTEAYRRFLSTTREMFNPHPIKVREHAELAVYVPPFHQLPEPFDELNIRMQDWADPALSVAEWDFVVRRLQLELCTGSVTLHRVQNYPAEIIILPDEKALQQLRERDCRRHSSSWNGVRGSGNKDGSHSRRIETYECSLARKSAAEDALAPKRMNRVRVRMKLVDGVYVVKDPCPFMIRVMRGKKSPVCVVFLDKPHVHNLEDQLALKTASLDSSIAQYIRTQAAIGRNACAVHMDLRMHVLLLFAERHIKVNLSDKRLFPTLPHVRSIMDTFRCKQYRFHPDDVEDVRRMAEEYPQLLTILQRYEEDNNRVKQHLILHVGGPAEKENYTEFGAGKLILLDATHKFNDVGYRTFTMMSVDFVSNKPRICGHMITSDLSHNSIQMWLEHVCGSAPPSEVLIDCDSTETLAIEQAFQGKNVHIAYCFFHCIKAILANLTGLARDKKRIVKALLRRLFLTRNGMEFSLAMQKLESVFTQWPSVKEYWEKQWKPNVDRWSNQVRRYPQVRTTNFLESFHQFLKYSGVGANRQFIRRVGDAIRTLLRCDASRTFDISMALAERVHGNGSARVQLKALKDRASKMVDTLQGCTHDRYDACSCTFRVVCDDAESGLFTFEYAEYSYDVNMEHFTCTCEHNDKRPHMPCKHMLVIAKQLSLQHGADHFWHSITGSRCDCARRSAPELAKRMDELFTFSPTVNNEKKLLEAILEYSKMHFMGRPRPEVDVNLEDFGYVRSEDVEDPAGEREHSRPSHDLPNVAVEETGFPSTDDGSKRGEESDGGETAAATESVPTPSLAEVVQRWSAIQQKGDGVMQALRFVDAGKPNIAALQDVLRLFTSVDEAMTAIHGILPLMSQGTSNRRIRGYAGVSSAHGVPQTNRKRQRTNASNHRQAAEGDTSSLDGDEHDDREAARMRSGGFLSIVRQTQPASLASGELERRMQQAGGRLTMENIDAISRELFEQSQGTVKKTARRNRRAEIAGNASQQPVHTEVAFSASQTQPAPSQGLFVTSLPSVCNATMLGNTQQTWPPSWGLQAPHPAYTPALANNMSASLTHPPAIMSAVHPMALGWHAQQFWNGNAMTWMAHQPTPSRGQDAEGMLLAAIGQIMGHTGGCNPAHEVSWN